MMLIPTRWSPNPSIEPLFKCLVGKLQPRREPKNSLFPSKMRGEFGAPLSSPRSFHSTFCYRRREGLSVSFSMYPSEPLCQSLRLLLDFVVYLGRCSRQSYSKMCHSPSLQHVTYPRNHTAARSGRCLKRRIEGHWDRLRDFLMVKSSRGGSRSASDRAGENQSPSSESDGLQDE